MTATTQTLRGYALIISQAIGITDPTDLADVEDSMRNDIFHSTLDWQTKAQFNKGAREAWELIQYMRSPEGLKEMYDLEAEMACGEIA